MIKKEVDDMWFDYSPALLRSDKEGSDEDKTSSVSQRITALNIQPETYT